METYLTYRLGVTAFENRDYRAAAGHFETVLADAPGSTEAREYLVRAQYHRGALAAAEREARALLDADPTNEYMTLLLIRTLERLSRHAEAGPLRQRLATLTGDASHAEAHQLAS